MDGRHGVLNRDFTTIAAPREYRVRQDFTPSLPSVAGVQRVRNSLAGVAVPDLKHAIEWQAVSFFTGPPGHVFRDGVEKENLVIRIGRRDGVANTVERH